MALIDLPRVAEAVGLSPSVLSFLLAFLASLPVSFLHRFVPTTSMRHLYSFLSGAALCWFAYGGLQANLRLYVPILFAYVAMLASRRYCGYIVFVGSFAYLVYCHVTNLSGDTWRKGGMDYTGTLMVLTLKVTSCALDYQDGLGEKGGVRRPSAVELLGYALHCGAALAGPVFDLKGYRAHAERTHVWDSRLSRPEPSPFLPAAQSFAQAVVSLAVYQTLNTYFPGSFLVDPRFFALSFTQRWAYLILAAFAYRWMFYFIWSVAETAMILSGLGFTGWSTVDPDKPEWKRAQNVDILRVELGWSAAQLPAFWNMSVANWMRRYVYDRLAPPAGRAGLWTLVATQAVSALWHVGPTGRC